MRPGRILATVTAAQVLAVASATVVSVALPDIARDLGADGSEQQWIVDAFVLVFASLLVAGGVLGDRHGRRTAFLAGLVLFAAGSLVCALAPDVEVLIAGRVLQALGPPLVLPASLAIVSAAYVDPAARARAIGLWGAGSGVGLALGPLMGGLLVGAADWRAVFAVNVVAVAVLVPLGLRGVPRDRPVATGHPFDAGGALLLTSGVAALVFAVIEGRELGWGSAAVVGAFAAGTALVAGFLAWERRHAAPLVDVGLLRDRRFAAANLGGGTMFFALLGWAVYTSLFLQDVQGRSALETGLCLAPQGILTALCAPLSGRLVARMGPRVPILLGMGAAALAFVALLGLDPGSSYTSMWWPFALLGAGIGIALPPMTVTALAAAPPERTGMASAIHNASRQLGGTLGVAILGTVVFAHGDYTEGLVAATALSAGLVAVVGVVAAGLSASPAGAR